jgi:hypothetical protein
LNQYALRDLGIAEKNSRKQRLSHFRALPSLFLCVLVSVPIHDPCADSSENNHGTIENNNVYQNPVLGMRLSLPGSWHFINGKVTSPASRSTPQHAPPPKCPSPICGDQITNVAMASGEEPFPNYDIFLLGYKLSPDYMDRTKYPLRDFADLMIMRSLGEKWDPEGKLTVVQFGSKSAYRLIVHNHHTPTAKGLLYVAESNGYIFLLVGTALHEPATLQVAIENMRLGIKAR